MAMSKTVAGGVCVFLTVFLAIPSACSINEYYYQSIDSPAQAHHIREHSVEIELLEKELTHSNKKRDIAPQPHHSATAHKLPEAAGNGSSASESTRPPVVTSGPYATGRVPLHSDFAQTAGRLLDTSNDAVSNLTLQRSAIRNLGENGTGIRHVNISNVLAPVLHDNTSRNSTEDEGEELTSEIEEDDKSFNETLKNHNITDSKTDNNLYYNSSIITGPNVAKFYWVDMSNRTDVKTNKFLSSSYRRAVTVKLSFDFPFYGHLIKNVTIATGGFLYTGDYVHSWLAATQYIAPLMANFDTSLTNQSFVRYADNGTAFTIEWERVQLQDGPNDGEFTFQVTLYKTGDIVFVYKNVPLLLNQIREHYHPVKVGISDAYIMDQTVFLVRRKTIYEYDRVNFNKTNIRNSTAIYLKALPTCHDFHDCTSCLTTNISTVCRWCPTLNKCSVGFDRNRQDWLARHCDKRSFVNISMCSAGNETDISHPGGTMYTEQSNDDDNVDDISLLPETYAGQVMYAEKASQVGMSGIIAILFLVGLVTGMTFWVFYAYRNPHTLSGQMLIRYRPSQWRWRRGEARYTAATIHM